MENQKRAFGHLCRQYGSLPGHCSCESLLCQGKQSTFIKDEEELEKVADSLLEGREKLLLTNFLALIIKSGARVALGRRRGVGECRCGSRFIRRGNGIKLSFPAVLFSTFRFISTTEDPQNGSRCEQGREGQIDPNPPW